MTSKRSRPDADTFPENHTSNKRRVIDSSDGHTSNSPDGDESHFGEFAVSSYFFQWYVQFIGKYGKIFSCFNVIEYVDRECIPPLSSQ